MPILQRGRTAIPPDPQVSGIRVLSRADLTHLTTKRSTTAIQTLRDSHHRLARAVASGIPGTQIAATCGISQPRLSVLKGDPAFQELVAHYRAMLTAEWLEAADPVIEFLGIIRTKSLAMIEDKIDAAAEAGEFLPSRDLATFAELGLDRTGYGKVNKNLNVNVDFASRLEKARRRSDQAKVVNPSPALAPIESQPSHAPQSASGSDIQPPPSSRPAFRRV